MSSEENFDEWWRRNALRGVDARYELKKGEIAVSLSKGEITESDAISKIYTAQRVRGAAASNVNWVADSNIKRKESPRGGSYRVIDNHRSSIDAYRGFDPSRYDDYDDSDASTRPYDYSTGGFSGIGALIGFLGGFGIGSGIYYTSVETVNEPYMLLVGGFLGLVGAIILGSLMGEE